MSAPAIPDTPRPWYRHPVGVAYLVILALVALAALVVTIVPVGGDKANKAVVLLILYGVLDVMMVVPLAFWAFGRKVFRLSRYPAVDLLLGLLLFGVAQTAVVVFLFFACIGVTGS